MRTLLLLAALAVAPSAFAQPSNDTPATATVVTTDPFTDTNVSFTTATDAGGYPNSNGTTCDGSLPEVFYTFVAQGTNLTITIGSPSGTSYIQVFESEDTSFTQGEALLVCSTRTSATLNTLTAGRRYYVLVLNTGGDSDVTFGNTTLPVELTGFTATASGADALLRWETASETNNSGFDVQVADGQSDAFRSMGWVAGHGTTLEAQSYSFRLGDLAPGAYRFRLHQVDLDGASEFSPVVELTIAPKGYALRVPGTFDGAASVALTVERSQSVRVAAYDLLGRQVALLHDGDVNESAVWTLSGDLPSGVYFVRVEGESFATTAQTVRVR